MLLQPLQQIAQQMAPLGGQPMQRSQYLAHALSAMGQPPVNTQGALAANLLADGVDAYGQRQQRTADNTAAMAPLNASLAGPGPQVSGGLNLPPNPSDPMNLTYGRQPSFGVNFQVGG